MHLLMCQQLDFCIFTSSKGLRTAGQQQTETVKSIRKIPLGPHHLVLRATGGRGKLSMEGVCPAVTTVRRATMLMVSS